MKSLIWKAAKLVGLTGVAMVLVPVSYTADGIAFVANKTKDGIDYVGGGLVDKMENLMAEIEVEAEALDLLKDDCEGVVEA